MTGAKNKRWHVAATWTSVSHLLPSSWILFLPAHERADNSKSQSRTHVYFLPSRNSFMNCLPSFSVFTSLHRLVRRYHDPVYWDNLWRIITVRKQNQLHATCNDRGDFATFFCMQLFSLPALPRFCVMTFFCRLASRMVFAMARLSFDEFKLVTFWFFSSQVS